MHAWMWLAAGLAAWAAAEGSQVPQPWVVEGRIAAIPHAHPLIGERGADVVYVDWPAAGQIVAYVRGDKPAEGAWARLSGRALEFEAQAKRGGRSFKARQLDVSSWEALPGLNQVEDLVSRLGSDSVSLEEKSGLLDRIYERGWEAFPVLIAHLEDPRVYEKNRDIQNYYALPPRGPRPEPLYADVTVGSMCVELLHRLLIPRYRSPHERVFKPRGDMFVVKDWRAWWRANRGKTLAAVHKELEPLLDRYYLTGGDPQTVEVSEAAPATPSGPPGRADGLAAKVDREIALEGTAVDQKLGAVLLTDGGQVWIEGLDSWPSGWYLGGSKGKRVRVKGVLRERADLPTFVDPGSGGVQRAGIPAPSEAAAREAAKRYVLSQASWELSE